MDIDAFTLKKHLDTGEFHIFKGKFTDKGCNSHKQSICGAMSLNESEKNINTCQNEGEARKVYAKLGRAVCANCIKDLYKTI